MNKINRRSLALLALFTAVIIWFALLQTQSDSTPSIIHESADILHYENGSPYIHDILTNHTNRTITATEYGMLAYNDAGAPLALHWHFLDSSEPSRYDYLVRTDCLSLAPNQTKDYHGGWSLSDDTVAYTLLCLKQVIFEDGTVWNTPDYDDWLADYAGKSVAVNDLQAYYPHAYPVTFE